MFGYVGAEINGLTQAQKQRYGQVYCGICRRIRLQASGLSRLCLSYDMTFLALLLMSLYEPEEETGKRACGFHPFKPRPWTDNPYISYAADMNVALAYYNCLDDWQDDRRLSAGAFSLVLKNSCPKIAERYPRQCAAIEQCLEQLSIYEKENCPNPDLPAGCFGRLMGELLVYREDHWSTTLRQLGNALGRFIYLADAAVDYPQDQKTGSYNPFIAMGVANDRDRFDEYLTLTMGRCAESFEHLPLVQDKDILNNMIYSGIWVKYRKKQKEDSK